MSLKFYSSPPPQPLTALPFSRFTFEGVTAGPPLSNPRFSPDLFFFMIHYISLRPVLFFFRYIMRTLSSGLAVLQHPPLEPLLLFPKGFLAFLGGSPRTPTFCRMFSSPSGVITHPMTILPHRKYLLLDFA